MKSLEENLAQYAAYHRDRRNIATHFAGIPMIVFAILLAATNAWVPIGPVSVTLAALVAIGACVYYFMLDVVFGVAMALTLILFCAGASEVVARTSAGVSLGIAALLFALGWALQLLGHRFEGRKPAFLDDTAQLLIGPLFVCAEIFFLLGAKDRLRHSIEERVGNRGQAPDSDAGFPG